METTLISQMTPKMKNKALTEISDGVIESLEIIRNMIANNEKVRKMSEEEVKTKIFNLFLFLELYEDELGYNGSEDFYLNGITNASLIIKSKDLKVLQEKIDFLEKFLEFKLLSRELCGNA